MAQGRWIAPASFIFLIAAYHLIFGQYFPTRNGTLGHDFSFVLPGLLDGYFWLKNNGIFEPFWFTPAFCGGQPALGDPGSSFYSITQFLTLFANPLSSIYATVLLFASLGFWGFYLLLRSCFGTSRQAAVLGGALFMFNGFFTYRMLVGHFGYHGMMLIPMIAWFLLRPIAKSNAYATLSNGIAVGCILAYWVYSGLIGILLPCSVAVLGIVCVHGLAGRETQGFVQRSLVAALVTVGLSATKFVAMSSFLHNFSRSDYSLPGINGILGALHLLFNTLFFSPVDIVQQAMPFMSKMQWMLDRHEWEFGVSFIPLLIILAGAAVMPIRVGALSKLNASKWIWLAIMGFVFALPLALNIYTPDWNAFLKQLPVIKSNSNLLRWFLIYIPIVILIAALLLDKILPNAQYRSGILIAALAILVLTNTFKDREYYRTQLYRPDTIVKAWHVADTSASPMHIQNIGAYVDADNKLQRLSNGNDMIAAGASQLLCYNPIFGYRLEHFQIRSLHPGPVLDETDGLLNIKNPACYLYPQENACTPGAHFARAQHEAAQAFADYKPYPFEMSVTQRIANWITLVTLTLLALFFSIALSLKAMRLMLNRNYR